MIDFWILGSILVAPALYVIGNRSTSLAAWLAASLFGSLCLVFSLVPLPIGELSRGFAAMVFGVGAVVFWYCAETEEDQERGPLISLLWTFGVAMIALTCCESFLGFVAGWEGVSLCSFFLIRLGKAGDAPRCAKNVLLTTGLMGLLTPIGIAALAPAPSLGAILIAAGCVAKSAQVPFSGWLPLAMRAPTPVSAFLHSATMVQAGVFVLHRYSSSFLETGLAPWIQGLGLLTLIFALFAFIVSHDAKASLAWTTVAALGLGTILSQGDTGPFLLFTLAHALYKAPLFMIAGYLEKQAGHRDWRRWAYISELPFGLKVTAWITGWAAIALPFSLTLAAKREIDAIVALTIFGIITSWGVLRVAIMPTLRARHTGLGKYGFPALTLALANIVLGIQYGLVPLSHLPAVLGTLAIAVFLAMAVGPSETSDFGIAPWTPTLPRVHGFHNRWLAAGLGLTGLLAVGSLFHSQGAVPLRWETTLCVFLAGGVAICVPRLPNFKHSLVAVGGVGALFSIQFALSGAPDLALTQLLVEGISLALVAAFVLRRPRAIGPERPSTARAAVATLAGVGGFVITLAILLNRTPSGLSDEFSGLAERAHASNIVNAILVDFRGFDTLGEISVLALAVVLMIALNQERRKAS